VGAAGNAASYTRTELRVDAGPLVEGSQIVFEDELDPAPPALEQVVAGPGMDWTKQDYCVALIENEAVWCDYIAECCTLDDQASVYFIPPDCTYGPTTLQQCMDELTELEAAGVVFDGTWAEECVSFVYGNIPWAPETCSGSGLYETYYSNHDVPNRFQVEACRRMTRGTKTQGQSCTYRSECEIGLACVAAAPGSEFAYQCEPMRVTGEVCDSAPECAPGLFCISEGLVSTCGALRHQGEPCGSAFDCLDNLQCVRGECTVPLSGGASCTSSDECLIDHACTGAVPTCVQTNAPLCDGI
jgi:hypothetical protein